jgi:hypothetical protein
MVICGWKVATGGSWYILSKRTLVIRVENTVYTTYVKNRPFGENSLTKETVKASAQFIKR